MPFWSGQAKGPYGGFAGSPPERLCPYTSSWARTGLLPINLLLLVLGLGLLIGGASALVRGASALALRLGVPPLIVGLSIVAFGTSTPELIVNLAAAFRGNAGIGFGNVVGSNIANIGLLLAGAALVAPLTINRTVMTREIPMMVLASVAALILGGGGVLGEGNAGYTRGDGLMLLLLFGVFLYYMAGDVLDRQDDPAIPVPSIQESKTTGTRAWAMIGGGLVALVAGGELTVRAALEIAAAMGLSETVIGLTVVAVGTSLPELATTVTAARQGQGDIAVGNIVGSNIYNLLFIWGLSTALAPGAMPERGVVDLAVMTILSLFLFPMVFTQARLSRTEGALILLGYVAYIAWLTTR